MVLLSVISISLALFHPQEKPATAPAPTVWEVLQNKYDLNKDAKISPVEHGRGEEAFWNLDTDDDGFITQLDFETSTRVSKRRFKNRNLKARNKLMPSPKVGEIAPDFELRVLLHEEDAEKPSKSHPSDKKQLHDQGAADVVEKPKTIKLSSFAGTKPVALIFGSYT